MRLSKLARFFCAGFDTVAMGGIARLETNGRFPETLGDYVLWGSVLAAAICAIVIATSSLATVAWVAIGYVLFGGLLTPSSPHIGFVLLALALMPLVPRPRDSLSLGIGIAAVSALVARVAFTFAP